MAIGDLLAKLAADQVTGNAILLIAILPVLDFATGSLRAIANDTFDRSLFDVWVRTKIGGRVLPLILTLLVGEVVGSVTVSTFSFNVVTIAAMAAAVTFIVTEASSIVDNLRPSTPDPLPVE